MRRLRSALPATVGPFAVDTVEDFAAGGELPPSDLLAFTLTPGARLAIRPSGTEAKLKVYAEVQSTVADDAAYDEVAAAAAAQLDELRVATMPLLAELMTDA